MNVTRWGIIGCGDVTERKSGPAFQRASHSDLVAVMRRDAAKARDYAERHKVKRWYTTVEELLADEEVDAVYVATPPGSHLDVALKVVAAKKPCYIEKPMARNFDESLQMVSTFQFANVPLFVAYYRRAYPRYVRLKQFLASGGLGELSAVHYTLRKKAIPNPQGWRFDVAQSGGGLFVDVGSHALDLLDFLFGPLREVRGAASRSATAPVNAPEDVVTASFLAGEAILGSASWNYRASNNLELMEVVGSRGQAKLPEPMNGAEVMIEYNDGTPAEHWQIEPPSPSVQEPLIQTVVDAIRSNDVNACPSTAESALRTGNYMDLILEGFYGGRADSFWERPHTWNMAASRPGGSTVIPTGESEL
eukprot:TRINITY_DN41464_c0_g1_i1.p1 TRINITY_DN41464_c0_g1~~TRINITY_DN41464_c0_g1_i1.p1  ORF type:complete len:372 (+),score=39.28 TRINITY_DN41464_c0_g1_i1:29-1117(+)